MRRLAPSAPLRWSIGLAAAAASRLPCRSQRRRRRHRAAPVSLERVNLADPAQVFPTVAPNRAHHRDKGVDMTISGHVDDEFLSRRRRGLAAADRGSKAAPGRVLIADRNRLFAEALMVTIDVEPSLEPIGYALESREAIELAEALEPDVVVIGTSFAQRDIAMLRTLIGALCPEAEVVVLRPPQSADEILTILTAACRGARTQAARQLSHA